MCCLFTFTSGLDLIGPAGETGVKGQKGESGESNSQSGTPGVGGLKGFQGPQGEPLLSFIQAPPKAKRDQPNPAAQAACCSMTLLMLHSFMVLFVQVTLANLESQVYQALQDQTGPQTHQDSGGILDFQEHQDTKVD